MRPVQDCQDEARAAITGTIEKVFSLAYNKSLFWEVNMHSPFDFWTIAHGLVGFFLGRIKLTRWLFYPVPVAWEIYQLFFHYQPQGYRLKDVWLNSLCDILICSICYEIAGSFSFFYERNRLWLRISNKTKTIIAYVLVASVSTWVFWDDIFRLRLSAGMPSVEVPLILGACSPVIACFVVWTWLRHDITHLSV
jgi:hypothetical protein